MNRNLATESSPGARLVAARETLSVYGAERVSDRELLALALSDTSEPEALADRLLPNLERLLCITPAELSRLPGIGPRASQLYGAAVRVLSDAARRAALLATHAPVVVPHVRPDRSADRCRMPDEMRASLDLPIEGLSLGVRAANCLDNAGIKYVGDLVARSEHEILKIPNMGRITLREIGDALAGIGLHFGMDVGR